MPPKKIEKKMHLPFKLSAGFDIEIYAEGLPNARDLEFSPEGTLLVSLTKEDRVVALIDQNKDGKIDETKNILTNLRNPHGLSFYPFDQAQGKKAKLFVVEESRVARYFWDEEKKEATLDKVLFSIPAGGRHFTRSIVFSKDGELFVSIGSTCDVCFEKHQWFGSVIVSDEDGKNPRIFAKGLRNSVFITTDPQTDKLWGTEMGRDFLGDDLPPDEINIIEEGKDYGWPVCFGNKIYDLNFGKKSRSYCENTQSPIYEIQAHAAPLGLTFGQGDLLVAYHGSWNRSKPVGYKVVRLKIRDNRILGEEDFITGFLPEEIKDAGQVIGRPVDLIFNKEGSLFLSDDKAGIVYKITRAT